MLTRGCTRLLRTRARLPKTALLGPAAATPSSLVSGTYNWPSPTTPTTTATDRIGRYSRILLLDISNCELK